MEVRRGRYLAELSRQPHAARRRTSRREWDDPAARSRPRVSEGPPHHGAGAVDLVPDHRSQSAEVCAEHLQGADSDFHSATQRVYCSPDLPSHIVLPLPVVRHILSGPPRQKKGPESPGPWPSSPEIAICRRRSRAVPATMPASFPVATSNRCSC